jgi:putative ABC transport system substrate-binding protein
MKKAAVPSILVVVLLLAVEVIAEAQQPTKVPRIGYLSGGSPSSESPLREAFRQGLRDVVGAGAMTLAAKSATKTIPIVMAVVGDPVGTGVVASLSKPGGNVTGLSIMSPELSGKRLELLKEIVSGNSRVAVFAGAS